MESEAELEARLRLRRIAKRKNWLAMLRVHRWLRLVMWTGLIALYVATIYWPQAFSRPAEWAMVLAAFFAVQEHLFNNRIDSLVSLLEDEGFLRPEAK